MDAGGVQQLLLMPRTKHTFHGLSFAFFSLSAIPTAFERVVSLCLLHLLVHSRTPLNPPVPGGFSPLWVHGRRHEMCMTISVISSACSEHLWRSTLGLVKMIAYEEQIAPAVCAAK